jgi:hypothetical protein
MADLSELISRLKAQASPPPAASSPPAYQQPTVSSPIFSPSPSGPQPNHQSAIISPNTSSANTPAPATAAEQSGSDRTANLLNLLKFNQAASSQAPGVDRRESHSSVHSSQTGVQAGAGRPVSASDLVASFMKKPSSSMSMHSPAVASPASGRAEPHHTSSTENPQNLLLRLLNHPKPSDSNRGQAEALKILGSSNPGRLDSSARVPSGEPGEGLEVLGSLAAAHEGMHQRPHPFESLTSSVEQIPELSASRGDAFDGPQEFQRAVESSTLLAGWPEMTAPRSDADRTLPEMGPGAVEELGKQVEEVLAVTERELQDFSNADKEEVQQAVKTSAAEVKRSLEDPGVREAIDDAIPQPVVKAMGEMAEEILQDNVADSWESADAEDSPVKTEEHMVRVYNFPMKPFTSISIEKLHEPPTAIRQDIIMDIARLKKEFDQIDRNLVAASRHVIVYALAKQGGFRVIRQETGHYRQVFQGSKERIFNLALCTATHGSHTIEAETILGTGVNGCVFWASVPVPKENDSFGDEDLDQGGFILPPAPPSDENTSGGQLKTRAKTSFRHPELFAVGRGKSIHLVYPMVARSAQYTDQKTRMCDTEKYLRERTLKIVTGKAGKDFAFSADDTVIVSLDKAGKMRFWDIRTMVDKAYETPSGPFEPVQIKTPILALQTTSPTDKSWPTSVFFLDKERPLAKGIALRYMVVGQKQNHTLQLWDLGLGKAVQELNLPHEKESDAICSVAYHAKTGVMVIGHPTRNSIYFVHVSAPRYNLGVMSQAKYLTLLAEKNQNIPKPDSTAIMSGIREYSFASKGQLRSLYLLDEHASSPESYPPGDAPIFELYVMHSKGVTVLGVRREDLGWTDEYRVRHPVDAEASGAIVVSTLRPAQPVTDASTNGDPRTGSSSVSRTTARDVAKRETASTSRGISQTPEATIRASTLAKVESKQDAERAAILNGSEKTEKKKKKKAGDATSHTPTTPSRPSQTPAASVVASASATTPQAAQPPRTPLLQQSAHVDEPSEASKVNGSTEMNREEPALDQIRGHAQNSAVDTSAEDLVDLVRVEFQKALSEKLDTLHERLDEDKRVQDAAGSAKMDAVLRLVSSTLSENVEKTLGRIINHNFANVVLPGLSENLVGILDRRMSEVLHAAITSSISTQMSTSLPGALSKAMQEPDSLRIISDLVANKLATHVDSHLKNATASAMSAMSSNIVNQITAGVERRMTEQLRQAEVRHQEDTARINQLAGMVRELSEAVRSLSLAQAEHHKEAMALQHHLAGSREVLGGKTAQEPAFPTTGDEEVDSIAKMIANGHYKEGTIKVTLTMCFKMTLTNFDQWIQSPRQAELFDVLFVRCNPAFIQELSPLVALSVSAAVTSSLESNLVERLRWLEAVLGTINPTVCLLLD